MGFLGRSRECGVMGGGWYGVRFIRRFWFVRLIFLGGLGIVVGVDGTGL